MLNRLSSSMKSRLALLNGAPPIAFGVSLSPYQLMAAQHELRADAKFTEVMRADGMEHMLRADAMPSILMARALEVVDQKVYTAPLKPVIARSIVPFVDNIPSWAETYRYGTSQAYGQPKVMSWASNDIPMIENARGPEYLQSIDGYVLGWKYTVHDLEASIALGVPLQTEQGVIVRNALEARLDETLLIGDPNINAKGWLKMDNVPTVTPVTKTGGGTAWAAAATGFEIVTDLLNIARPIQKASGNAYKRIKFLMDTDHANRLDAPMTGVPFFNGTIRNYISTNHSGVISEIVECDRCATAGAGGTHRIMAYPNEGEALLKTLAAAILSEDFRIYPGQWIGLEWRQFATIRCGGAFARYPLYFRTMDGT